MTKTSPGPENLVARSAGFTDLDEYECAIEFAKVIGDLKAGTSSLALDLRQCWVDYSHSAIYIDAAIKHILSSDTTPCQLTIITSVDLGSKESMACLFFQGSIELGCKIGMSPQAIAAKVQEVCLEKNILLAIDIFSFDQEDASQEPKIRYNYATK